MLRCVGKVCTVLVAAGLLASPSRAGETEVAVELKSQIAKCWVLAPDTRKDSGPVTLRFQLNPDGSLKNTPTIVQSGGLEYSKALVMSAIRAIKKCAPYTTLKSEDYKVWKKVTITFHPVAL